MNAANVPTVAAPRRRRWRVRTSAEDETGADQREQRQRLGETRDLLRDVALLRSAKQQQREMMTTDIAMGAAVAGGHAGETLATDSPITIAIAPIDAQVEIQSSHPTRKPA